MFRLFRTIRAKGHTPGPLHASGTDAFPRSTTDDAVSSATLAGTPGLRPGRLPTARSALLPRPAAAPRVEDGTVGSRSTVQVMSEAGSSFDAGSGGGGSVTNSSVQSMSTVARRRARADVRVTCVAFGATPARDHCLSAVFCSSGHLILRSGSRNNNPVVRYMPWYRDGARCVVCCVVACLKQPCVTHPRPWLGWLGRMHVVQGYCEHGIQPMCQDTGGIHT